MLFLELLTVLWTMSPERRRWKAEAVVQRFGHAVCWEILSKKSCRTDVDSPWWGVGGPGWQLVDTCEHLHDTLTHAHGKKEPSINPGEWSFKVTAKGPELNWFKHIDVLPGAPPLPAAADSWIKSISLIHRAMKMSAIHCCFASGGTTTRQRRSRRTEQLQIRSWKSEAWWRNLPPLFTWEDLSSFSEFCFCFDFCLGVGRKHWHDRLLLCGPGSWVLFDASPLWGIQCCAAQRRPVSECLPLWGWPESNSRCLDN